MWARLLLLFITDMKKRVAIVDDDAVVRQVHTALVQECGYSVVAEGASGIDAIEICRAGGIDLIILDIDMPGMGGLNAARKIVVETSTPILLVTGVCDHSVIKDAIEAGVTAYIIKPVRLEEIEPAIEFALFHALECKGLREQVGELKGELASRRVIEKAKGLLMEHNGIGEAEAFARIRKISMDKRKRMKEVAEAVIITLEKS